MREHEGILWEEEKKKAVKIKAKVGTMFMEGGD